MMRLSSGGEHDPIKERDTWHRDTGRTIVMVRHVLTDGQGLRSLEPIPDPGVRAGLVEIRVSMQDAVARIEYTYRAERAQVEYAVRGFTEEAEIVKHKDFDLMFSWYGSSVDRRGNVEWAHLDPGEPRVRRTEGGKRIFDTCPNPIGRDANPMRGVQDFLRARLELTETTAYENRVEVPASVVRNVGTLEKPPDAAGRVLPAWIMGFPRRKWLCAGANIQSSGAGARVTRSWLLDSFDKDSQWAPGVYR
jgi:hypothetical protein